MNIGSGQQIDGLLSFVPALRRLARDRAVTREGLAFLQRHLFAERSPDRDEVEALFALDAAASITCEAWTEFFVGCVVDHVVWASRPTGIVGGDQAEWLLRCVDAAGTPASLAALVAVFEEAHRAPAWFGAAVARRSAAGRTHPGGGTDAEPMSHRRAA